jgi:hypothetical protein
VYTSDGRQIQKQISLNLFEQKLVPHNGLLRMRMYAGCFVTRSYIYSIPRLDPILLDQREESIGICPRNPA